MGILLFREKFLEIIDRRACPRENGEFLSCIVLEEITAHAFGKLTMTFEVKKGDILLIIVITLELSRIKAPYLLLEYKKRNVPMFSYCAI